MHCPYCGKEMELGYIQCRDGVTWTPKKHFVVAVSLLGKDSVSLENGAANNSRTVYAYKCGDCKKVIVDYSTDSRADFSKEVRPCRYSIYSWR